METSSGVCVTSRGNRELSFSGVAEYIKVFKRGYEPMSWSEVWSAFSELFPDRWAIQAFPPAEELVDGKNVYHLFVLAQEPANMNIKD